MSEFDDNRVDQLVEAIGTLAEKVAKDGDSQLSLTPPQEALMKTLYESKKPWSLKELRDELRLDNFKISRLIASLEDFELGKKKVALLKREMHPEDKRQWVISLSGKGSELLTKRLSAMRQSLGAILDSLSSRERDTLISLIDKMIELENV